MSRTEEHCVGTLSQLVTDFAFESGLADVERGAMDRFAAERGFTVYLSEMHRPWPSQGAVELIRIYCWRSGSD